MKVLIIEDEIIAVKQLTKMITNYQDDIEILDSLDSILDSVNFLSHHTPDLIFMDIHLADGLCFEIFEQMVVDTPVIFTTAYDQYTLKAFKVNSVDYLLKPIHPKELQSAIKRFEKYRPVANDLTGLLRDLNAQAPAYKRRFLVRSGKGYISISTRQVAYIFSKNKLNYLVTTEGKRYVVDYTLEQLEKMLNPRDYIRINRNFIVSNVAIERMEPYFNNRMLLQLKPPYSQEVLVSRNYLKEFKKWVEL